MNSSFYVAYGMLNYFEGDFYTKNSSKSQNPATNNCGYFAMSL